MTEIFTPENLIAGGHVVTDHAMAKAGIALKRGTVICLEDSTDKQVGLVVQCSGEAKPYGILAQDIIKSDESKPTLIYLAGEFFFDGVIHGENYNKYGVIRDLRAIGIFLKNHPV
jgi:hypothetical protein